VAERALAKIASQLQLAERLQHLIYLRSSLIVVSGKKGAGKSIAVENISNLLPVNTIENIVTLNSTLNESQVREKILSLLFDKPLFNPEEHLLTSVLQLQKDAIVVASRVLIIDNAQLLPDKMIVEFAEIIKNKDVIIEGEFNILFFCEQAYADKLFALLSAQFDALKNFYQEFKVPPLSNEEVEQLFRHESQQVKQLKKIVLSKEYVACLVACNGNPLEIITLVHKLHNLKKSDESATENKKAKKIINTCEVKKNKNLPKIILFVTILLIICGSVVFYFYPQFNMIDNPKGEIKAKKVENTVKKSHTSNTSNISKLRQVRQHQQDELKNELNIDMDKLVLNWSDIIDKNLIKDASHQTKMTKPDIIVSFIAQGNRLSEDTKVPMDVKKKQPIENKVNVALPPYVFKKGYIEK
jgi:DamX protein